MFDNLGSVPNPNSQPVVYGLNNVGEREQYWRATVLGLEVVRLLTSTEISGSAQLADYMLGQAIVLSQKEAENCRIENLSNTDPLTGASNRRAGEAAYEAWRSAKPIQGRKSDNILPNTMQILFVDADDLKAHNENFNHSGGDELLKAIVGAMQKSSRARGGDTVVRWGGDEFLLLCPGMPRDRVEDTADAIREDIKDIKKTTVSIGIGTADVSKSLDEIVAEASIAMKEAKKHGKNRTVHFDGRTTNTIR